MASSSSQVVMADHVEDCCVACGIHRRMTPKVWTCALCPHFLLCENCYDIGNGLAHHHPLTEVPVNGQCDCCDSYPIFNQRWRCLECKDLDLCDQCYKHVEEAHEIAGHSREHPMFPIKAKSFKGLLKPNDRQWAYQVDSYGVPVFKWVQTSQNFAAVVRTMGDYNNLKALQTSPNVVEELSNSDVWSETNAIRGVRETTPEVRSADKNWKIFLSHAGAQKDFVEQLHVDLQHIYHLGVFFDKDNESLPKGEQFPPLIFKAGRECELAVILMSDEYFTRKWPMLELATFVEEQKVRPQLKILPVFYKLSLEEFKQSRRQQSYIKSWKRFATKQELCLWKEALRVIPFYNGIHFHHGMGELKLREEIVKSICDRVPPNVLWDDSHVQGKIRMTKIIKENLQEPNKKIENYVSPYILGIYGMAGSGKTTLTKVFCNNMMQLFLGKVCHIELGSRDFLELRKQLLLSIAPTSKFDKDLWKHQANDLGKTLKFLKDFISKVRICLIIDNVSDNLSFLEEANTYLTLPFAKDSMVLVTARSIDVLRKLKISSNACMRIPTLQKNEAISLFSHHASCDISNLSSREYDRLEKLVEQCCFQVEDMSTSEYHPLALKVLGSQVGPDIEGWQNIVTKHCSTEYIHPIFSILRSSYDLLRPQYQRMYLDLALYQVDRKHYCYTMWRYVHGERDENFMLKLLKDFLAKSLIEYYDDLSGEIRIHDLYREFAQMEVERKECQHSRRCYLFKTNNQRYIQEHRLCIKDQEITQLMVGMLCECSNSELLSFEDCFNLKDIDVRGMPNLVMLQISGCPQLASICVEGSITLQSIFWEGFQGEYPRLIGLESLECLVLRSPTNKPHERPKNPLDLSSCPNLEVLNLQFESSFNFKNLVKLRRLVIKNCQQLEMLEGLEAAFLLKIITLEECSSLREFPSLSNFPFLRGLFLTNATKLKQLHGLSNMINLTHLSLKHAMIIDSLDGIRSCILMEHLDLENIGLQDFSWLSSLIKIRYINLSGTKLKSLPSWKDFCKLKDICLNDCSALENLGSDIDTLPCLKSLRMRNCKSFKNLPNFKHSNMTMLDIGKTNVEDIHGIENCTHLQYLLCDETLVQRLPDLTNLVSLKFLDVSGCLSLTTLENIKGLPTLEILMVSHCTSLLALPDLRGSKNMNQLFILNCPLLDPHNVKLPNGIGHANIGIQEDHEVSQDVETTVASYLEQETSLAHDSLQFSEMFWRVLCQVLGICQGC